MQTEFRGLTPSGSIEGFTCEFLSPHCQALHLLTSGWADERKLKTCGAFFLSHLLWLFRFFYAGKSASKLILLLSSALAFFRSGSKVCSPGSWLSQGSSLYLPITVPYQNQLAASFWESFQVPLICLFQGSPAGSPLLPPPS